jgi:hypothetical protein
MSGGGETSDAGRGTAPRSSRAQSSVERASASTEYVKLGASSVSAASGGSPPSTSITPTGSCQRYSGIAAMDETGRESVPVSRRANGSSSGRSTT